MIFKADERLESVRPKPQDGAGEIHGLHYFNAVRPLSGSCFKMSGQMTLPPGSAIGFHVHHDDEEIYIIVSGRGQYTKNNGQAEPVAAGDLTLTRKGEGHGLANDGDEPLVFLAVIAA